jgi:cell division protein FtsQ
VNYNYRRKKRVQISEESKRKILSYSLLLALGVFCLFQTWHLFYNSSYFVLEKIHVKGAASLDDERIIDMSGLTQGMRTFEIELDAVEQNLVSHPWIKTARLTQVSPTDLQIDLTESSPEFFVRSGLNIYGITKDGELLDASWIKGLEPKILAGMEQIEVQRGRIFRGRFETIQQWKELLDHSELSDYSKIEFESYGKIVVFYGDTLIFVEDIDTFKKHEQKVLSFLKEMEIEKKKILYIDVRFEDMVVKLA